MTAPDSATKLDNAGHGLAGAPGYLPNESTAAASGDGEASQRSRGRDESSLTPYYEASGCTIYHGDCRVIMPRLKVFDLLLVDPPYGMRYRHSGKNIRPIPGRKTQPRALGVEAIVGDDEAFDPRPLLDCGKDVIMWGAHHYANLLPNSNGWLVWNKLDGLAPSSFGDCDLAWRKRGNSVRMFVYMWRGICQAGEKGKKLHPAQKPIELMRWCIMQAGDPITVLDPYMGSGSTLVAAKSLGKLVTGIEIEERYCEIAAKRLEQEVLNFAPSVASEPTTLAAQERAYSNTTAQADNHRI